ncbi:hypothetical protein ACW9HC_33750 [Nocardia gipuzkoensis]
MATLDIPEMAQGTFFPSREEEAVALACGMVIAGQVPLVSMQNSGLANSLNTIGSLAISYEIGFVCLVTVRGGALDSNPVHRPVGRATVAISNALEVHHVEINAPNELRPALVAAYETVQSTRKPAFVHYCGTGEI